MYTCICNANLSEKRILRMSAEYKDQLQKNVFNIRYLMLYIEVKKETLFFYR